MIKTILIARDRKTGKDILLAGREVGFADQVERYSKLSSVTNEDYSEVILAVAQATKKPLKFITKSEAEARVRKHKDAVAKAEKEVKKTTTETHPHMARPDDKHKDSAAKADAHQLTTIETHPTKKTL